VRTRESAEVVWYVPAWVQQITKSVIRSVQSIVFFEMLFKIVISLTIDSPVWSARIGRVST
jgi:hypothetical protein